MHRLILAAAAVGIAFLAVSDANSADTYPARQRAQMDRLVSSVQPYNWTGFYVGLNGGYGRGQLRNDDPYGIGDIGTKGWTFGATAGYNWQFANRWVLGLETDFNWANIGGSQSRDLCPGCGSFSYTETQDVKMPWFGTTRARLGFLPWQDLMVYATGGAAFAEVKSNTTSGSNSWWGSYAYDSSSSDWKVGWTAGGGAEYALDRNWSIKAEYLYVDIGLRKNCYSYSGFGYASSSCDTAKLGEHIVRAGLNYKF